jgi:hypothetical protein
LIQPVRAVRLERVPLLDELGEGVRGLSLAEPDPQRELAGRERPERSQCEELPLLALRQHATVLRDEYGVVHGLQVVVTYNGGNTGVSPVTVGTLQGAAVN